MPHMALSSQYEYELQEANQKIRQRT